MQEIPRTRPPQSRAYEELVEVVTRAVEKLSINWPAERDDIRSKGKLDERFLPSRAKPQCRGLPFFSWEKPVSYRVYSTQTSHYSSILNKEVHGYGEMPKVEETLASYLSPESSSSTRYPVLPTKPVRTTSALVGKAYSVAGRAAACLHTMSLLQAYQAELLADLDEGEDIELSTWKVFTSWCSDRQLDPVNCPVGTVLEFLQDGFTAGVTPSTLKVYVTAISAYHIPLGGMPLGKGILFPPWYFEAEACSSHQGADMGSGHCPARPFPGSL